MPRILFVCVANICRSPIAESTARTIAESEGVSHLYEFDSAGTLGHFSGQPPDPRAQQIASRHGYSMAGIKARAIALKDFQKFDLILAMDKMVLFSLQGICPSEHRGKLQLYLEHLPNTAVDEVPDPYYGNLDGFEHVLDLCEKTTHALLVNDSLMQAPQPRKAGITKIFVLIRQLINRQKT